MRPTYSVKNEIFDPFAQESEVRAYCRRMPAVLDHAINAELWDENGNRYIDFLSACGAMNYGHNNRTLKAELIDFLQNDGVAAALDLHTVQKRKLLAAFRETVMRPRGLDYKIQFPGPTGTNAVEAAIKLSRKVTGRQSIVAFSNGFHGMTMGALALTGNQAARRAAGVPLPNVHRLPFEGYRDASAAELLRYETLVN
ncbi:MAG: aminotransferase class III-fold pyridoxal phosphate-dependent enzyme, partial [Hyphomicrobium sp.]